MSLTLAIQQRRQSHNGKNEDAESRVAWPNRGLPSRRMSEEGHSHAEQVENQQGASEEAHTPWVGQRASHTAAGEDRDQTHQASHLASSAVYRDARAGVAEETVKGVMGWCSKRMIEVYSHTRLAAKADALSVLENLSHRAVETPVRRRRVARLAAGNVIAFPGQQSAQL